MGIGPMKLSAMREYIRVVYGLLKDETIEWDFEGERKKIRFLNPEFGMINITDKIPLHISAFAHKARKMTAEIADGWITFSALPSAPRMRPQRWPRRAASSAAIRSRFYSTEFALGCVLKPGESAASRAREGASRPDGGGRRCTGLIERDDR